MTSRITTARRAWADIVDSRGIADGINARNARTSERADAAAGFVVVLIVGILGALALVHYLTPCDGAALCALAVIQTRPGILARIRRALRAWELPHLIRWAEQDIAHMRDELAHLPAQISAHQQWIAERRIELIDCELDSRNN